MGEAGQALHFGAHTGPHGGVIRNSALDIGHRGAHAGLQKGRFAGRQQRGVDLNGRDHAAVFHGDDRVKQGFDLMALGGTFPQQRINQERHVRPGYLQEAARQRAVCAFRFHQHLNGALAGGNLFRPVPQAAGERADICVAQARNIFSCGLLENLVEHLVCRSMGSTGLGHVNNSRTKNGQTPGLPALREGFKKHVSNETFAGLNEAVEKGAGSKRARQTGTCPAGPTGKIRRLGGGTHADA